MRETDVREDTREAKMREKEVPIKKEVPPKKADAKNAPGAAPVKILLVGIGGYGANYMEELTREEIPGVRIEGICEVMPGAAERFPVIGQKKIPVYGSPEAFYREHEADLAVISSPIQFHYPQIAVCLRHGSNVLTEKPICVALGEAEDLIRLEQETGRFVAVGYQLDYSRDVLALKRDILSGRFGRPVYMKALHAMKRGSAYYGRNSWAGRIEAGGQKVNDSPFNNACAHQFQIMTFLLGDAMDRAAELSEVSGELYRANSELQNYDTAAVAAKTRDGVPLYYYTTHALKEKKLGPEAEYRFERAVIRCGARGTDGQVDFTAEWEDGSRYSYAGILKGKRLQKLYDAIDCTRGGGRPFCTIQTAMPHLDAVCRLAMLPVTQIGEEELEHVEENGERFCRIRNLKEIFSTCYQSRRMPSEVTDRWRSKKEEK